MQDAERLTIMLLIAYGIIMFLGGYIIAEWFYGWMTLENYQNQLTIHQYNLEGRLCMRVDDNRTLGVCPQYCLQEDKIIKVNSSDWMP